MEAKYLIRSLEGKLRISLAEQKVLTALTQAIAYSEAEKYKKVPEVAQAEALVKAVYNEMPNYDILVPALLKKGLANIREICQLALGTPL